MLSVGVFNASTCVHVKVLIPGEKLCFNFISLKKNMDMTENRSKSTLDNQVIMESWRERKICNSNSSESIILGQSKLM